MRVCVYIFVCFFLLLLNKFQDYEMINNNNNNN